MSMKWYKNEFCLKELQMVQKKKSVKMQKKRWKIQHENCSRTIWHKMTRKSMLVISSSFQKNQNKNKRAI